jgi:hypothetical protein
LIESNRWKVKVRTRRLILSFLRQKKHSSVIDTLTFTSFLYHLAHFFSRPFVYLFVLQFVYPYISQGGKGRDSSQFWTSEISWSHSKSLEVSWSQLESGGVNWNQPESMKSPEVRWSHLTSLPSKSLKISWSQNWLHPSSSAFTPLIFLLFTYSLTLNLLIYLCFSNYSSIFSFISIFIIKKHSKLYKIIQKHLIIHLVL